MVRSGGETAPSFCVRLPGRFSTKEGYGGRRVDSSATVCRDLVSLLAIIGFCFLRCAGCVVWSNCAGAKNAACLCDTRCPLRILKRRSEPGFTAGIVAPSWRLRDTLKMVYNMMWPMRPKSRGGATLAFVVFLPDRPSREGLKRTVGEGLTYERRLAATLFCW